MRRYFEATIGGYHGPLAKISILKHWANYVLTYNMLEPHEAEKTMPHAEAGQPISFHRASRAEVQAFFGRWNGAKV